MEIIMNVGLAGAGYRVAAGERTDRFDDGKATRLVNAGLARLPDTTGAAMPQLDHDGDGHEGGSAAVNELVTEIEGNALFRLGGGWHRLAGPLFPEEQRIRGTKAARAKFDARLRDAGIELPA